MICSTLTQTPYVIHLQSPLLEILSYSEHTHCLEAENPSKALVEGQILRLTEHLTPER